jgi:hypothetical protein
MYYTCIICVRACVRACVLRTGVLMISFGMDDKHHANNYAMPDTMPDGVVRIHPH